MSIHISRGLGDTLVVYDFDDTLVENTNRITNMHSWKPDFKGDAFHRELLKRVGPEGVLEFHRQYSRFPLVQSMLREGSGSETLMITAGISEIQKKKIHGVGLTDMPVHVTPTGEEKTGKLARLLRQRIREGRPVPREVILYEDRPHNYQIPFLEALFQTKFSLVKVDLGTGGPGLTLEA